MAVCASEEFITVLCGGQEGIAQAEAGEVRPPGPAGARGNGGKDVGGAAVAQSGGQMGLAGAGVAHEQDVLFVVEILAPHEFKHQGLVDGGLGGKVEGIEGFEHWKLGGPDTAFRSTLFALEGFPFD